MPILLSGSSGITYPNNTVGTTGNGPAFSAFLNSGQSIPNNTWTKVQLNGELFDTASCFDASTNYRFTPNVAGYYQINMTIQTAFNTSAGISTAQIYKNGSNYLEFFRGQNQPNTGIDFSGSVIIFLNGSSDYIELYYLQNTGSSQPLGAGSSATQMSGALVRGS
jgi:hypothetical protein